MRPVVKKHPLPSRASMQYSRGGGTMSQMSVPAGAWEDLRREVGEPAAR